MKDKTYKPLAPAATAAIKIIEALSDAEREMGVSEISVATGINKNMISRILSDLVAEGWITANEDSGKYSLTLQLFRLGSAALGKKTLSNCAEKHLRRLNDITGECVQLAVLNEKKAIYIMQFDSKKIAGVRGRVGGSYSLDVTAPGKILKAFILHDEKMRDIVKKGYSTDNEEYGRGVICLAAPVYDYTGEVIAALGISSLTINLDLEGLEKTYLDALLYEAEKLSEELGYKIKKR